MAGKRLFFALMFFISVSVPAQEKWYHYDWPVENSKDNEIFCNETYLFDKTYYKNNRFIGANYDRFCQETVTYLFDDLSWGNVYKNFDGMEVYVKKVLEKLVPDQSLTKNIKIVFYRDASVNASMSESGLLRLNIGMMAKLNNEAELAMLLGHEIAHFLNEDVAKSYARIYEKPSFWTENPDWDYETDGNWFTGYLITIRRNEWYSREQEEAADHTSIDLIKKSSYSPKSASNMLKLLKREEIRDQINYGKSGSNLRTHPDPGKRIQLVKDFSNEALNQGKKNYLVDSLQFAILKEKCFMELVNICLEDNLLDRLMTVSFSRYLFEPENENNLSVLIEALRRFILLNKETKNYDRSFILHQYQNNNKGALKNYPFLSEKNPSILDFLFKGFLDIWKEELPRIRAFELADPDVTEFTTYYEAYEYFRKKAKENQFTQAEHYKYFGEETDWKNVDAYQKINSVFLTNDYLLRGKTESPAGKVLVMMPFSSIALSKVFGSETIWTKTIAFNEEMKTSVKSALDPAIVKTSSFSLTDKHLFMGMINTCVTTLNAGAFQESIVRSNFNWPEACPEAYSLFVKNGASDLYTCLPYIYSLTPKKKPKIVLVFYKFSIPQTGNSTSGFVRMQTQLDPEELKDPEKFFKKLNKEIGRFFKATEKG